MLPRPLLVALVLCVCAVGVCCVALEGDTVDALLVDSLEAEFPFAAEGEAEDVSALEMGTEAEEGIIRETRYKHKRRSHLGDPFLGPDEVAAVWKLNSNRFVANSFDGGVVIGNAVKNTHVVCEDYETGVRHAHFEPERASWCWGYISEPEGTFGGWKGSSSCAWYPLFSSKSSGVYESALLLAPLKHNFQKCGSAPRSPLYGELSNPVLFKNGSYTADGRTGAATVGKKGCQAYLNFDPHLKQRRGKVGPRLEAGKFLPYRYVTQDRQVALVHLPGLEEGGFTWFFVKATCMQF